MTLLFELPNGEVIDLLDDGPNGMEYICCVCGEFDTSISQLIEDYKQENSKRRRLQISDEIRDQSYFFAGEIGNYDEELQQLINWDELAEQIYQLLIKSIEQHE